MSERTYRYRREDFRPLPLKLEHMTMCINFAEGRVDATNSLEMTARADLSQVVLDAKDLQIHEVRWCPLPGTVPDEALVFDYRKDEDRLIVTLPRVMTAGERFCIRTVTTCIPMGNILEGIYKDTTPPGGPQQYMSQCQQWGFQRIMPVFDDCTAKCTMTTTIEADARYTHLISNGNICHSSNPAGKPVPKSDDPTRQVITYENPIPMAPYLFIVCAGTWDMLADEVVYPSGRTVRLEYLVPPGMTDAVRIPMEILKESILWVEQTQAYEYSAETYRTICMNKSNFGGMENVGNTTIVTDSAVITEHTLDAGLLYAYAVIVHEFEHNQCGSETTMETPFDVWLNEAYTVDVERQFMAQLFDPSFVRLNQIEGIRNPLLGPLAVEDAGYAGRIVREGFNDPEELIDGVTYVKAAEVIRMLRLLIGEEKFLAAKQLYFTRYRNGNADTEQFFACFEEISGISLRQFREGWLYRAGYPKVAASVSYDADTQRCSVRFEQESAPGTASFHFPVELALVDDHGHDLPDTARTVEIRDVSTDIVFENILNPPAFVSLNRDFSFYGTLRHEGMSKELLALQAQLDGNVCNRVDAFRRLTDMERIKLLEDENAAIDPHWLSIYGELLDDASLSPAVKAYLLRIDEQPVDRAYLSWYQEQVRARERLMLAVNGAFHDKLVSLYHAVSVNPLSGDRSPKAGIEQRMLKNVLLELISIDDTLESHQLIIEQYRQSATATERVAALLALNRSSSLARRDILEEAYTLWHPHLSGYANYLRVVAGGTCSDVFEMIEREKRRLTFDITQPTWTRALFLSMAMNNKMIWSDAGREWFVRTVTEFAPINMTTAGRLLNTYQHARNLRPALKGAVMDALAVIMERLSEADFPALHNQAKAYLKG